MPPTGLPHAHAHWQRRLVMRAGSAQHFSAAARDGCRFESLLAAAPPASRAPLGSPGHLCGRGLRWSGVKQPGGVGIGRAVWLAAAGMVGPGPPRRPQPQWHPCELRRRRHFGQYRMSGPRAGPCPACRGHGTLATMEVRGLRSPRRVRRETAAGSYAMQSDSLLGSDPRRRQLTIAVQRRRRRRRRRRW